MRAPINLGDFRLGQTIDFKFTSESGGVPAALAGSPSVTVYNGNSTTQSAAGVTLTVNFDGVTGLNHVRIVATSGNGFANATEYQVVVDAGTVGGSSVVGMVVGSFSIGNRSLLDELMSGHTATDSVGQHLGNIESFASQAGELYPLLKALLLVSGTVDAGSDASHLVVLPSLTYGDGEFNGHLIVVQDVSTLEYHARWITNYLASTFTFTLSGALPFTPESFDQFWVFAIRQYVDTTATSEALAVASAITGEVHVGDVGTVFEATVYDSDGTVVDISLASTLQMLFRKPNGTVVPKTATRSGSGVDGKMRYVTTLASDLDVAGGWSVQGVVAIGSGSWKTSIVEFTVKANLQ